MLFEPEVAFAAKLCEVFPPTSFISACALNPSAFTVVPEPTVAWFCMSATLIAMATPTLVPVLRSAAEEPGEQPLTLPATDPLNLTGRVGPAAAVSWLAFTVGHLGFFGLGPTLNVAVLSAALVWLYLRERSLWPVIVLHALNSLFAYMIAPLLA